jgi:adenosylcobyric acid synthase
VETTFAREKRTCRVVGRAIAGGGLLEAIGGHEAAGYEIHMGQTAGGSAAFQIERRLDLPVADLDGAASADGLVVGTYLHGLFANAGLRRALLAWLAARKGRALSFGAVATREAAYDRLAEAVRASLDLSRLADIVGVEANLR